MIRLTMTGVLLSVLLGGAAAGAPEKDLERQAAIAQRFEPFDSGGGAGWEAAFPTPFLRDVTPGKPEAVTFPLKAGSYMVVVLCNCRQMDVSLVGPDATQIAPLRKNDQAAMYSIDVAQAGEYLTGVDLDVCDEKSCDVGVKVYRKKS